MAGKTFRKWVEELSPTALLGALASRQFGGVYGLLADALAESTRQAVMARFFGSETFPADAVERLGADRLIPKYFGEGAAAYQSRVESAWDAWQEAGTDLLIEKQLLLFGVTAEVYENFQWDWDSMPENWSRFWVVITVHPWTAAHDWGDTGLTWGGGLTWGSSASVEEVEAIQKLVNHWKRGDTICVNIIVVLNPGAWTAAPTGDWQFWENRDTGAIYWDGV